MTRIFLHIGLIKTATTFLQSHIFNNLNDVNYVDRNANLNSKNIISEKGIYLISNEGISGNPFNSKQEMNYYQQFTCAIERIKEIYSNPKIICCFREPSSFIQSTYKQYLHEGGTLSFNQYFKLEGDCMVKPSDFLFSRFLNFLQESFKPEQVFAYNFGDFLSDKESLIKRLLEFIGTENSVDQLNLTATKKSNPSVPYHLEGTLIKANKISKKFSKMTGRPLRIRLFGKVLNGRVIVQYILPKIIKGKSKRDISKIQEYYANDWDLCLEMMKSKP